MLVYVQMLGHCDNPILYLRFKFPVIHAQR